MKENTGNVEPTPLPETDLEGKPYPKSPPIQASKEDEAASLVTPNATQVIPPDGEGVNEFKHEKLENQDAKPGGGN